MYERHLASRLKAALEDTPVVLLNGARQVGKSTLARQIQGRRYLTLDDADTLSAASLDPQGFIESLHEPVVLDEIQKIPNLFPALKLSVDRNRRPGHFLLTGSADVLLLPRVSESLAGRMEILTLWPLSQGEIDGRTEGFVDRLFSVDPLPSAQGGEPAGDLMERILRGGYPEPMGRPVGPRREDWFRAYVSALLQRDVRDLAQVERLSDLPRLLSLLAGRAASLLNISDLSRGLGIPLSTLRRHLSLLETTFLVQMLPAWSSNMGKRLVRAPKVLFNDSALLAHLLGAGAGSPAATGALLENFVAMEVLKQTAWSLTRPQMLHFRTHAGREVDLVLEDRSGRIVGIEVKSSTTLGPGDFAGLKALEEACGERFVRGVVLYGGRESLPFGKSLQALPVSALWS